MIKHIFLDFGILRYDFPRFFNRLNPPDEFICFDAEHIGLLYAFAAAFVCSTVYHIVFSDEFANSY